MGSATTDSLKSLLPESKGNKKIELLNELAKAIRRESSEECIKYAEEALILAQKEEYTEQQFEALNNIGLAYYRTADYAQASEYLKLAVPLAMQLEDDLKQAKVLTNLGVIQHSLGNYYPSLEYLIPAFKLYKKLDHNKGISTTTNNIGVTYYELKNFDKALEYYFKALEIKQDFDDPYGIASCFNNIGITYSRIGDLEKALDYNQQAFEMYKELEDDYYIATVLNNLGEVHIDLGNYITADKYYQEALKLSEEMEDDYGVTQVLYNLGQLYLNLNQYDRALTYLNKSLPKALEIEAKSLLSDIYFYMSDTYKAKKDFNNAYHYHQLYAAMQDSMNISEAAEHISQLESQFQVFEKAKEVELLIKNTKIKDLMLGRQTLALILGGTILLLLIILFIVQQRRFVLKHRTLEAEELLSKQLEMDRQKMEDLVDERTSKLNVSHIKLRKLTENLQKAQETERARISREIHDELGQSLTAAKLELDFLKSKNKNDENITHFTKLSETIKSILDTVRRISRDLHPGILQDLGLIAAIEWQVNQFKESSKIDCELNLPEKEIELDFDQAISLYRVLQESLTNINRHAKADKVHVTLEINDGDFLLKVWDNGKGITDTDLEKTDTLGILSMRERVGMLGGTFDIESFPGNGTTIKVHAPLQLKKDS